MFLAISELKTDLYEYQIKQIIEEDESIALSAINAGIEECKSYFTPNNQIAWLDGRLRYNADAIFAATGDDRNPLVLAYTKDIALYHLVQLNNTDVLWDSIKEKYDRAIAYLKRIQKGEVSISSLPLLELSEEEESNDIQAFRMGSRKKFNHE